MSNPSNVKKKLATATQLFFNNSVLSGSVPASKSSLRRFIYFGPQKTTKENMKLSIEITENNYAWFSKTYGISGP